VPDIASVALEWDALAHQVGAGPFARPGWYNAFGRAFDSDVQVLTVRDGTRLTGVLPIRRTRTALLSPTNWHSPAYGAVAADDDAARALAAAAVELAPARLDLSFLDPSEAFTRHLIEHAGAAGRQRIVRPALRSPYVALDGDFAAYEQTLPSKFRREINRRLRKLGEEGEVEIAFSDGRGDLDRLLDEGVAVEGSGWKTAQGTAIAQDDAAERLYRDVARWAAERGWLQLGFVRVGGRAVAFSYALAVDDTVHVLKVGFDPAYARFAVGTLLTREAVARAYEQGRTVYDFLGGEDRYKLDWTDRVRERVRVQAFARTAVGAGTYVAWRHGRPMAKRALAWARARRSTDR
jgi:CelD/BcsL family acetyltransferase involved in cellulose biosynthesis